MPLAQRSIGGMNIYRTADTPLSSAVLEHTRLFAGYAAVAVANILSYAEAANEVTHLRIAMESRAVIEQAKGIIMVRDRCTADEAYQLLTRISQQQNVKLRELAQTAKAPDPGPGPVAETRPRPCRVPYERRTLMDHITPDPERREASDPQPSTAGLAGIATDAEPIGQILRRIADLAKQTLGGVGEVSLTLIEARRPRSLVSTGRWPSSWTIGSTGRLRPVPGRGQERADHRRRLQPGRQPVLRVRSSGRPRRRTAHHLGRDASGPAHCPLPEHLPRR